MIRYLFMLCVGICFYTCTYPKNTKVEILEKGVNSCYAIVDSINPYNKKIKRYGNDSIYAFNSDSNLSYIIYLDSLSKKQRVIFNNSGTIKYIEYNYNLSDALLEEYYYDTEKNGVKSQYYRKDTIIITDGNPIQCFEFDISYYESGQIKETGYTGSFWGQNVPVGMQKTYNENGSLHSTIDYIYPIQKSRDIPISEVFSYVIEKEYYINGRPRWEKRYKNYELYEMENDDDLRPIGTWKFYHESGNLIRIDKY